MGKASARKIRKGNLLTLFVLAFLVVLPFMFNAYTRPLIQRATRVTDTIGKDSRVCWLSDNELLFFSHGLNTSKTCIFQWDIRSGSTMPLPALTSLFNNSGGEIADAAVSPNGSSLLWYGNYSLGSGENQSRIFCSALDGSYPVSWLTTENPFDFRWLAVHWLSDSEHLIGLVEDTVGFTRLKYTVAAIYSLKNVRARSGAPTELRDALSHIVNAGKPTVTTTGHIFIPDWSQNWGNSPYRKVAIRGLAVRIIDVPIHSGSTVARPIGIHTPSDALTADFVISPHGDHIAWLFEFEQNSQILTVLHRLLPWSAPHSQGIVGIWVSNIDGTGLHEIGQMPFSLGPLDFVSSTRSDAMPVHLSWLPGGKRLSFLYKDVLWTLPSD